MSGLMVLGGVEVNLSSMGVGEATSPGSLGVTNSIKGASLIAADLGRMPGSAKLDWLISSAVTNHDVACAEVTDMQPARSNRIQ